MPGALRVETTRRAPHLVSFTFPRPQPCCHSSPNWPCLQMWPERSSVSTPSKCGPPRSSRGCGGFWTSGQLICLSGHSPHPGEDFLILGPPSPGRRSAPFPTKASGSLGPPVWVSEKRRGQCITHLLVSERPRAGASPVHVPTQRTGPHLVRL